MANDDPLQKAIAAVPAGRWAAGVSGGADSVALLALLRERADLQLHVVHLNHQTRGDESERDAKFVYDLAKRLDVPCTIETLDRVLSMLADPPANRSARFRAARLALFARVVVEQSAAGVLLAHHRLDHAETVMLRLMRGSGVTALVGMAASTTIGRLRVMHPLLDVAPERLRDELRRRGFAWREDASNTSPAYRRNRVRTILQSDPSLADALVELASASAGVAAWLRATMPAMTNELPVDALDGFPPIVREWAARRWLVESARVPVQEIGPASVALLLAMLDDAAAPSRADFPGGVQVVRRKGVVRAMAVKGNPILSQRPHGSIQFPAS